MVCAENLSLFAWMAFLQFGVAVPRVVLLVLLDYTQMGGVLMFSWVAFDDLSQVPSAQLVFLGTNFRMFLT
jgi:hypothetical protein